MWNGAVCGHGSVQVQRKEGQLRGEEHVNEVLHGTERLGVVVSGMLIVLHGLEKNLEAECPLMHRRKNSRCGHRLVNIKCEERKRMDVTV